MDVPWIPSPIRVVEEALRVAKLCEKDVVYDLGSGDGRVVVTAASMGARAVGIEKDKGLVAISRQIIRERGLEGRAEILEMDFRDVDLSDATVVYIYIYYSVIKNVLMEKLDSLKPGTRVISMEIPIPGWMPVLRRGVLSESGVPKVIYLYIKGLSDPSSWVNDEVSEEWKREFLAHLDPCGRVTDSLRGLFPHPSARGSPSWPRRGTR